MKLYPGFLPALFCLFSGILLFSCTRKERPDCSECKLELATTSGGGSTTDTDSWDVEVSGGGELGFTRLKQLVEAKLGVSATYRQGNSSSESIYWAIAEGDPNIAQGANLYRSVTCALMQIACENAALSPGERAAKQEAYVMEYWAKLDEITKLAASGDTPPQEPEGGDKARPPKPRGGNDRPGSGKKAPPAPEYFNSSAFAQVAILATGDKSFKDLSLSFRDQLQADGYSVNTSLFRPSFRSAYASQLRGQSLEPFTENNASRLANCACFFDQSVRLDEAELAGEPFIKAVFSGRATLFNLKNNTVNRYELNATGSGVTQIRAMESLEEKLAGEFARLSSNLASCR